MRNYNEWELRRLQLELQQLDEDFTELNNYFGSEAFDFSKELPDEVTADFSDPSVGVLTSYDAADERNDVQMMIDEKLIIY